jgi:hypothetical protein
MKTTWLARRLGLDRNPLRRRPDKIAVCLAALLVAMFLIGAPLLSVAATGWAGRAGTARQPAGRSWRQVPAVLLQATPAPGEVPGYSRVLARWWAPDGRARTGQITVRTGLAAGRMVPLWVDTAGSPAGPPLSHRAVLTRETAAAAGAAAALAIVLLCLAWAGRRTLDQRRLARWEAEWATVGPEWARRFWSRG